MVYDITKYLTQHPGGADILVNNAGIRIDELVTKYHSWVNVKHLLKPFLIGPIDMASLPKPTK